MGISTTMITSDENTYHDVESMFDMIALLNSGGDKPSIYITEEVGD